jgi:enamine deaminase RidA (YjgF/YER057c/UK114 family)
MSARKSIKIDSLSHLTAIPVATRIGPLLVSSVIAPFNPGTRLVPDTIAGQYSNIFHHVGLMLHEAGADWRHVAKMEFWTPQVEREALDPFWIEKFPDEASRPARHTHVGEGKAVTAAFIAYVTD